MADTKEHEMSLNDIWAAAEAKFKSLTGESLRNGQIKSFDTLRAEIESSSKPASGDAPADKDKKEKFKSAGLEFLQYAKLLVGAAVQVSAVVS